MMRTIKTNLSSAIAQKLLTFNEFATVIKEVENIINSRPLTYQGTDSEDVPLTLSRLICGRDLTLLPLLLTVNDDAAAASDAKEVRYQYVMLSNTLDRFQKRWSSEYLCTLSEKHNNRCATRPSHHLYPGSLVMVQKDDLH